jgi:hypothetical protein
MRAARGGATEWSFACLGGRACGAWKKRTGHECRKH